MSVQEPKEHFEHQWIPMLQSPDSIWEERRCGMCHLVDMRIKDEEDRTERTDWKVNTACIEEVQETVAYAELIQELKDHGVRETPLVIGVPGKWTVGFCIHCNHGRTTHPDIQIYDPLTLEHGFAELLRWIRARGYDVNRYSDYRYLSGLYSAHCPCADDD